MLTFHSHPPPPERICWGQGVSAGLFQPFHEGRRAGVRECSGMWGFTKDTVRVGDLGGGCYG